MVQLSNHYLTVVFEVVQLIWLISWYNQSFVLTWRHFEEKPCRFSLCFAEYIITLLTSWKWHGKTAFPVNVFINVANILMNAASEHKINDFQGIDPSQV